MSSNVSEPLARRIFELAVQTGQSGKLLDLLFDGGSVTVDAQTGQLVMIPGEAMAQMANAEPPEWCTCRDPKPLDDLDVQERAGLIGVWLTPADDGQMPLVSLELIGGRKRYARVWIDGRDQVEWGWVLPDKAIAVWRDPEFSTDPAGEPDR